MKMAMEDPVCIMCLLRILQKHEELCLFSCLSYSLIIEARHKEVFAFVKIVSIFALSDNLRLCVK